MREPDYASELMTLAEQLYPICRSITGKGVRKTLKRLQELVPLSIREVPTGTKVFDWEIPDEWNIGEAWIKDATGRKIIDISDHNLHVLNYSVPVEKELDLRELKNYLHSLPDQPDAIPYRTTYYQRQWGFCLAENQRKELKPGRYEVRIDSSLEPGSLTYGELVLPGESSKEFLLTTHVCHPSMANDNVSGMTVLTWLARLLASENHYYTYRLLWIPGTIGSITWLAQNQDQLNKIKGGLVVSGVGDESCFHYKKSRQGDSVFDRICSSLVTNQGGAVLPFTPYGYDERQFCSPGINLPVGNLSRSIWGSYREYHTSGDNLDFISGKHLQNTLLLLRQIISHFDETRFYLNTNPHGEPQLGKHGLYHAIGGRSDVKDVQMAMLWVLNLADGQKDLKAMELISGLKKRLLIDSIELLKDAGLLTEE